MRRITRCSIPLVMAGLVLAGRSDDQYKQAQQSPASGAPPRTEQQRESDRQSTQERPLSEQQRNQQSTFQPGQVSQSQVKKNVTDVNKASSFIGMQVKNLQNEDIGKINDLVFDPANGKISYTVISVGGFLGIGDKLIAVPITSLRAKPGEEFLLLNMNKGQVQAAPGLAQNNWPDLDATGVGRPAAVETSDSTRSESSGAPAGTEQSSETQSTDGPDADASIEIDADTEQP